MKILVITGGSKGIGNEITLEFLSKGYTVISASRSKNKELLKSKNFHHYDLNVSIENDFTAFSEYVNKKFGEIDVFINNAGFSEWRRIENIDETFLREIFSVNVFGYFYGSKMARECLKSGGSLINISSLAALRGTPSNSAYVATKFAIRGITQSLSKELGPLGIRVNAVNPVLIKTDGLQLALESDESPAAGKTIEFLDNFAKTQTSLGRLPTAKDVAALAYFLTTESAKSITGQSINIDCGVLPN